MREIALGDLRKLTLLNVLKTLLVENKTGVLTVKGKEEGEIYLEKGNVVHAKTNRSSGEEAFLAIMGWRRGKCVFKLDAAPVERTISTPADQLLLKWSHRRQEWEKIREAIPSPDLIFRLSLQKDSGDKNITGDQWSILALTNGMRTISEIAEAIGWSEYKTYKVIYQLLQTGLLEKAEEQKPARRGGVGEDFLPTLEHELKRAIGPIATLVLEDKLVEFGASREFLPREEAESFVESLSEEIANEGRRREFIRAVAKLIALER